MSKIKEAFKRAKKQLNEISFMIIVKNNKKDLSRFQTYIEALIQLQQELISQHNNFKMRILYKKDEEVSTIDEIQFEVRLLGNEFSLRLFEKAMKKIKDFKPEMIGYYYE